VIAGLQTVSPARPPWLPDDAAIAAWLAARQPIYRYRKPRYQIQLLKDLASLLPAGACRIIDIGAGSGLLGEAIASLFPGISVTGVDIERRILPGLRIPFLKFDGRRLPFADAAFDCALFCNVIHHVKRDARAQLLREALRVTGGGPLLLKDHVTVTALDRLRLAWLDFLGNAPFGGMVSADYLSEQEWGALFRELECVGEALGGSAYRGRFSSGLFPNRLEQCFRVAQRRVQSRSTSV
jgi:SAM-dependent methyltransferase